MANYAGDVTSKQSWEILSKTESSALIDVRTIAEFNFVGITDLSALKKNPLLIEWTQFPGGQRNPQFEQELKSELSKLGADESWTLLFLCRSGNRSKAAAIAASALGYSNSYNISDGFEGDLDQEGHRGTINGWRASGLPWKQT